MHEIRQAFRTARLDLRHSEERLARVRAYAHQLNAADQIEVAWLSEMAAVGGRWGDFHVIPAHVLSIDPSIADPSLLPLNVEHPGIVGGVIADLAITDGEELESRPHPNAPEVRGRYVLVVPEGWSPPAASPAWEPPMEPANFLTPGELALRDAIDNLRRIGRDQLPDAMYPPMIQLLKDAQRLLGRAIAERLVPIVEEAPF